MKIGVGVGIIVCRDNEVLLLKRKNVHGEGSWSTPGGHLEYGESFESCAIREVKEETNLDIYNPKYVGVTNDIFENKHYVTIWMRCDSFNGEATINAPYEMEEIRWCEWKSLPKPLFMSFENYINEFMRGEENGSI